MERIIRGATPADLDAVTAVEAASFPIAEAATRDAFFQRLAAFPESFFVSEAAGQVIGMVNGCCTAEPFLEDVLYEDVTRHDREGPWQTVFGLAVLPNWRHGGAASELLTHLISVSRIRRKAGLVLTCKEPLIGFYGRCGFSCRGVSASTHGGAVWYDMILRL